MAPKKPVSTQKTTLFSFFSKKEKKKKSVDDEAVEKDRKTTVVQPSTSELSTTKKVNAKPMEVTKTQGNNNESSRHTSPKTPPTSTDNTDNSDDDDDDMASSPLVTKKSKRNSEEETTNDTTKSKRRYVIDDDDDDDDDEDEDEDPVDEEVVVIDTSSKMDVDKPPMKKATDNKKSNIDPKIVVTSTTTSSKGGKAPPAKAKKKAISSGWGFLNGDTSFKSSAKKRKKEANDSSTGHNNSHLKEPYKAGDDLPILCHPQDMFDDMILNQLCENGKRVSLLEPLIKSLHGRSLKIATMCSGTESPVLALDMIYKAIEDVCNKHDITVEAEAEDDDIESKGGPSPSRVRPVIRCEHIFSCEIEPFKQSYIERNFQPKRLFRDIRELGNDKACTAFGSLIDVPNTPGCVDILVAGTSCVDYSNLNNKKKSMDELGESGQTFQGMLNWIEKARPTIVIIENVFGAPWDEKVSIFESLGYAATFIRIDSKDYYIPQTRQRGYLFAILKDSKKSVDSKRVKGWENMMKKLERPASAALDAFMLTNDDPRVLRGRARLCKESSVGNSGESRAGRTDWTKCEGRHVFTRSNEELGEKRPLSNWSETANVSMPGFAWNDWVGSQVNRVHDLLDINTLRLAKHGVDNTYKTMIWNLSQNVDRDTMGRFNLSQCLTPTGIPYVTNRGGPLVGEELLLLQGIPADDLMLTKESEKNLKDLSGNAMTTTVVGACILSALLLGHEALLPNTETSFSQSEAGSIIESLVPRPLGKPSEIIMTQKYGNYKSLPLNLGQKPTKQDLSELFLESWKSARKCITEGPDEMSDFYICQDCGHSSSENAAHPVRNYEKHNFKKQNVDLQRLYPSKYRTKLINALPTVLAIDSLEIESIEKPEGVSDGLWKEWKRRVGECSSNEFRFAKLERREYWNAEYKSARGNSRLTLTLHRNRAEWLLFAEAPAKQGPLREFLERPVARFQISSSSKSILSGTCEIRLPIVTKTKVTIKACGSPIDSWRRRMGLKGQFEKEIQFEKLEISCSHSSKIEGVYEYLPNCGGACGSVHKKQGLDTEDDPIFFFLESGRATMPKDDSYSFSNSFHRTEYKEYREIILMIDQKEKYSPVFNSNHSPDEKCKELSAIINGQWLSINGVTIQEAIHQEASYTVPTSSLDIPMQIDGWKAAPELISFKVPMDKKTDNLLMSCIASGPMDLNLQKSKRCFEDIAFVTARLKVPLKEEWLSLDQSSIEDGNREDTVCPKCAPQKPKVVWKLVTKGKKRVYVPFEDWQESAAHEVATKARPMPWNVRLSASSSSLQVQIGLNVFSLCQRAFGLYPRDTWPRQTMINSNIKESNCSFDWRVVMHTEKSSATFDKFTFTSNKKDIESEQPPNFRKYSLRKEQSRSLTWMLNQERSNVPFLEEEVCENVLPSLDWRAEGRTRRPVLVRGGIIADEVGYGKTCITLACIDSNSGSDVPKEAADTIGFFATKATLVVVPGHLMGQWPNEVKKFLGTTKKVVEIKDMRSFNDTSVADILDADIVLVNFTVLCSEKYYSRIARLSGKSPQSFPSGKNGGRHFDSVYDSCIQSLPDRIEQIKEDCDSAFESLEKDALSCQEHQEQDGTNFRLDGKKAVYKKGDKANATAAASERVLEASEVDPWKLCQAKKDCTKMRCPPLEMFHWRRVVVDEFTYLLDKADRRRPLSVVMKLVADFRWVLSGTPSHESFGDIKCLAKLMNIHLGVNEALPGSEKDYRSNNEKTGAESMSQFLENKSMQWHERRRVIAQSFLDRFVRQNIAEIDEIPSTEKVVTVMPNSLERAIYLELETYLKNLNFNAQTAKMSRKKSQSDRENRMQKVLEGSKTAEEALLKCCAHFNITGDSSTALNTLEEIIKCRKAERDGLEETIVASVAEATRLQNLIEKEQPGWITLKKHEKGEMLNALGRYLAQVSTSDSVPHGADVEIGERIKELVEQAKKEVIANPDGIEIGSAHNSDEKCDDGKAKKRKVTAGDKHKGINDEDTEAFNVRIFGMKKKLRDDVTYVQGLGKELCGRVRSLRYIVEIRRLQQGKSHIQCIGCDTSIETPEAAILSCCGHIGCHKCVKEYATQKESCIVPSCTARVSGAHVVRSTNFTVNSTDESTDAKDGSKLTKMIQTIKGIIADGDRMIIFAQFDDLIERIAQTMKRNGIQTVQVKGRVEEQVKRLKPFQTDSPTKGDPSVLLLKMDDEQSAGLNLTQLNHVLFVHPLLAPTQQQYDAYETQAIGRVRRFGQNKTVFVWRFLVKNTIDTEIYGERSGRPLNLTTSN